MSESARAALQKRVVDQTQRFSPSPADGGAAEGSTGGGRGGARSHGKDQSGCRCGRTKCLKQYCQCFRTDVRCSTACFCTDCHNDGNHEAQRIEAVRKIRINSTSAFKGTSLEIQGQEVTTPRGSVKMITGCRCKNSKCKKKYCDCFAAGIRCTTNCVCVDCENGNGGNAAAMAAIKKTGKAPGQLRSPAKKRAPPAQHSTLAALGNAGQPPKTKAGSTGGPPTVPPSHRFPSAMSQAATSAAHGSGNSGAKGLGKKSFRRNDLKVGVPAPALAGAGSWAAPTSANIVTPHGSILLPSQTRQSPRLASSASSFGLGGLFSPPGTAGLAPVPGQGGLARSLSKDSPKLGLWAQPPSAGRRSPRWADGVSRSSPRWGAEPSPAMLREDSMWDGMGGMSQQDSLRDMYSPLAGDVKSPTTRSQGTLLLDSARAGDASSARLPGAGGGLVRRSSTRSSVGLPAPVSPGVAPEFGPSGLSGLVSGIMDPGLDPDGILGEPQSARSWAKNIPQP